MLAPRVASWRERAPRPPRRQARSARLQFTGIKARIQGSSRRRDARENLRLLRSPGKRRRRIAGRGPARYTRKQIQQPLNLQGAGAASSRRIDGRE